MTLIRFFTNSPLKETTDYNIHKIYNEKLLELILVIFMRLLYKLTTDCTIQQLTTDSTWLCNGC